MAVTGNDEKYLTSREAELLINAGTTAQEQRDTAHTREHAQEKDAVTASLNAATQQRMRHYEAHESNHQAHEAIHSAEREAIKVAKDSVENVRQIHNTAHDREHEAHTQIHTQEQKAVTTALDAVNREREIHAKAHEKEHEFSQVAIEKAEQAVNKRFDAVNGSREQLTQAMSTFASKEVLERLIADGANRWDELRKELDRRFDDAAKITQERYETNTSSIINLEKGDVKQEGRSLGQGAVLAIIVGAISFVGTLLGIIIVVSNALTGV